MSARYWVLVADEVMDSVPQWPDGLYVVYPQPLERPRSAQPYAQWWLFEDVGAPATLEGKRVELTLTRCGDKVQIGSRDPAI